jgi:hypothetical protein
MPFDAIGHSAASRTKERRHSGDLGPARDSNAAVFDMEAGWDVFDLPQYRAKVRGLRLDLCIISGQALRSFQISHALRQLSLR